MSEDVADFTRVDSSSLLNVDRAHKAVEKINAEIHEAHMAAIDAINARFESVSFEAQSVLYEAMAGAARAGFTRAQMYEIMQCSDH